MNIIKPEIVKVNFKWLKNNRGIVFIDDCYSNIINDLIEYGNDDLINTYILYKNLIFDVDEINPKTKKPFKKIFASASKGLFSCSCSFFKWNECFWVFFKDYFRKQYLLGKLI